MDCPSFEQLLAWVQNQLPASEASLIREHLDPGCDGCEQGLDQARRILAAAGCRGFIKPPDWLVEESMGLITRRLRADHEFPLERIPGFLAVDSFSQQAFAGTRNGAPTSRQLLYRAGEYNIGLSITPERQSPGVQITGRLLSSEAGPGSVQDAPVGLLKGTDVVCETKVNQVGMFTLEGIPEGTYDMKIVLGQQEIDIVGLHAVLRARREGPVD